MKKNTRKKVWTVRWRKTKRTLHILCDLYGLNPYLVWLEDNGTFYKVQKIKLDQSISRYKYHSEAHYILKANLFWVLSLFILRFGGARFSCYSSYIEISDKNILVAITYRTELGAFVIRVAGTGCGRRPTVTDQSRKNVENSTMTSYESIMTSFDQIMTK